MTNAERLAARALAGCRFAPATWDKRFAASMDGIARGSPHQQLTEAQAANLWRLCHRYRRQLFRNANRTPEQVRACFELQARCEAMAIREGGMTEATWLQTADVRAMLECWASQPSQLPYPQNGFGRKARLFAVGCCRLVWDKLVDDAPCRACIGGDSIVTYPRKCLACAGTGRVNRSRRAVEVAERYAEGEVAIVDLEAARRGAMAVGPAFGSVEFFPIHACEPDALETTLHVYTRHVSPAAQAALLRCVVGNPWRPVEVVKRMPAMGGDHLMKRGGRLVSIGEVGKVALVDEDWLTPTVLALAQACYRERLPSGLLDPDLLGVLADALEEAGCCDEVCPYCKDADFALCDFGGPMMGGQEPYATRAKDYWRSKCACAGSGRAPNPILRHLRQERVHCRGCHVVDAILGKE